MKSLELCDKIDDSLNEGRASNRQEESILVIETERLIITEFDEGMAEAVHRNSLDEDIRRFVPDEVFETVEAAHKTVLFLMGQGWQSIERFRLMRSPAKVAGPKTANVDMRNLIALHGRVLVAYGQLTQIKNKLF